MIRRILLAGLISVSLSCASSGGSDIGEETGSFYPSWMTVFPQRSPPVCLYAVVGRFRPSSSGGDQIRTAEDVWNRYRIDIMKRYRESMADALIEGRFRAERQPDDRLQMHTAYTFIQFADPDCRG